MSKDLQQHLFKDLNRQGFCRLQKRYIRGVNTRDDCKTVSNNREGI